jgi:hypothetical protein
MEHTPTPWHTSHIGDGEYRHEIVLDKNGGEVAEVIMRRVQGEQDATYIVKACNLYPEMVETLKKAEIALTNSKPYMAHYPEPVQRHDEALVMIRAILQKTEKE